MVAFIKCSMDKIGPNEKFEECWRRGRDSRDKVIPAKDREYLKISGGGR